MKMRVVRCILMLIIAFANVCYAENYYLDNTMGSDTNSGTSAETAWRTIGRVNRCNFLPGDNIFLKRGEVWEEELIVSATGAASKPIRFTSYGEGPNPLIKSSNAFDDWTLHDSVGSVKVWKGSMKGVLNSFGAVVNGWRVPKYFEYRVEGSEWSAPEQLMAIKEGFFFAPLNSGEFYFRSDAGSPSRMEIGARKQAILVKNSSNIEVDGIDAWGPSGRSDAGSETNLGLIVIDSSSLITIKNSILCHSGIIVLVQNGSSYCNFDNLTIYDSLTTALFLSEAGPGNKVQNSRIFACGNLVTDYGDMAGIGVLKTPEVTIERCKVYGNGHPGAQRIDALISFVQSTRGVIYGCLLRNAGGTAIQFAQNSDNSMAAYNIIDGWAVYGSLGHNEGIRIGGADATSTAKRCKIYNNLFINGGTTPGEWAALRILFHENEGLQVKNNIFYNNVGVYEIKAESRDGFTNWVFSNNLFYRTRGDAINWGGQVYDNSHIIGITKGYYSFDRQQDSNSIAADPKLLKDIGGLMPDSLCIGKGIEVGLSRDFFNNTVPAGGGINIGPFQGGLGLVPGGIQRPENLRIIR